MKTPNPNHAKAPAHASDQRRRATKQSAANANASASRARDMETLGATGLKAIPRRIGGVDIPDRTRRDLLRTFAPERRFVAAELTRRSLVAAAAPLGTNHPPSCAACPLAQAAAVFHAAINNIYVSSSGGPLESVGHAAK